MAHLGDFTISQPAQTGDPDTFSLDGQTFTVAPKIGALTFYDFFESAVDGLTTADDAGAMAVVRAFLDCVVDDDKPRLRKLIKERRGNLDDMIPILTAIRQARSEGQTDFPTEQPSDSQDGSTPTQPSSRETSSERASSRPSWWDSEVAKRERETDPTWGEDMLTVADNGRRLLSATS